MIATKPPTVSPPALNPKVILPFINSARSVMSTMLGVETVIGRPKVKILPGPAYDCSGIVSFSGDVVGVVIVSFPKKAAMKFIEAFAGSPVVVDSPDFIDALGELTNMIAGGAKKDLGTAANISVPTVIIGSGHIVAGPSNVPCLCVPCTTTLGEFEINICVKQL